MTYIQSKATLGICRLSASGAATSGSAFRTGTQNPRFDNSVPRSQQHWITWGKRGPCGAIVPKQHESRVLLEDWQPMD